jgi:multiple sugar transport system substrate-binding protein/sn-glycerol 3-phosphate transport system substrate-binding protein
MTTDNSKAVLLRLAALLLLPILITVLAVSCDAEPQDEGGGPIVTSEPAEQPTPIPSQGSKPYDIEIYGDLDTLDPGYQTIVFWHHHTGSQEELLLNLVDEFNRANEPDITVLAESRSTCDGLYADVISGLQARQLPDLVATCQDHAANYAALGESVALDPYIGNATWGYSWEELGDFSPSALAADYLPRLEAHYSWPAYASVELMYYNEEWLAELGYENPPVTWDEFGEMACVAVEQPFSGLQDEGTVLGHEYTANARRFATLIFSRGGDLTSEDGAAYVFNGPEGLRALDFLKDLAARGCAQPTVQRHGDLMDFAAGRVLLTISGMHHLPRYRQAVDDGAGFEWGITPPPHSADRERPRMNIHGNGQAIFRSTPEKQLAAWLFIQWMSEPAQQAEWAASTGYYPTRRSAVELMPDYLAENPMYEQALSFLLLDYAFEPPVAGYDACRTAIGQMLATVMDDGDPQRELDVATRRCSEAKEDALR